MKPWSPWRDPWFIVSVVMHALMIVLIIAVGAYVVMHIKS